MSKPIHFTDYQLQNGELAERVEADQVELTDSEKIEFLYQTALKADALMQEIAPQVGPILESVSKNPMLKMFLR